MQERLHGDGRDDIAPAITRADRRLFLTTATTTITAALLYPLYLEQQARREAELERLAAERLQKQERYIHNKIQDLLEGATFMQAVSVLQSDKQHFEKNHPRRYQSALDLALLTEQNKELLQFGVAEFKRKLHTIASKYGDSNPISSVITRMSNELDEADISSMLKDFREYNETKEIPRSLQQVLATIEKEENMQVAAHRKIH